MRGKKNFHPMTEEEECQSFYGTAMNEESICSRPHPMVHRTIGGNSRTTLVYPRIGKKVPNNLRHNHCKILEKFQQSL
jgi:hypothetical protein